MSLVSQLPKWAQGPVQQFRTERKISGTEKQPIPDREAEDVAAGILLLLAEAQASDEDPTRDEAMGEPGKLVSGNQTVFFEERGETVELTFLDAGVPHEVLWVQSNDGRSVDALGLTKSEEGIEADGAVTDLQPPHRFEGHLFRGDLGFK